MICPYCGYDNKSVDDIYDDEYQDKYEDEIECENCHNTCRIDSDLLWTYDYGYIEVFSLEKI